MVPRPAPDKDGCQGTPRLPAWDGGGVWRFLGARDHRLQFGRARAVRVEDGEQDPVDERVDTATAAAGAGGRWLGVGGAGVQLVRYEDRARARRPDAAHQCHLPRRAHAAVHRALREARVLRSE